MAAISYQNLRPLLDQFAGPGLVLSCYASPGATEGFRPTWRAEVKARADALHKGIDGDEARDEFARNLTAVCDAVEATDAAPGVAVFAAARRRFLHVVPLDVPVAADLVVDRSPYLVPLLVAAFRREYLAVQADTHRARVFAATPGRAVLLAELDAAVPSRQRSAGETWGYGQATIARRREGLIRHLHKNLAREVGRLWDAGPYAGLILLGEHEVAEHVRAGLPPRLAGRVVHEAAGPWYQAPARVAETVRAAVAELDAADEARAPAGFWDRLREGKAVAAGPRAVIEAVHGGRVGPDGYGYLVFGPDPRDTVGRCVACRSLADDPLGPCPKCQAPCAPGSLWEELLLTALGHRLAAHFVDDPKRLAPYGGVVAVLPKAD